MFRFKSIVCATVVAFALPATAAPSLRYTYGWSVTVLYSNPTANTGGSARLSRHYPTFGLCELAKPYFQIDYPRDKLRCDLTDELQFYDTEKETLK